MDEGVHSHESWNIRFVEGELVAVQHYDVTMISLLVEFINNVFSAINCSLFSKLFSLNLTSLS